MCGIAGYFGPVDLPQERVARCLALMGERRGPDGVGSYRHRTRTGRHAVLLHSRLSIIDLDERSNQPFRSGSHVLSYNGELYNYLELRAEAARNAPLTTTGDTEILARLVANGGWQALDRAEGMWAFALFNEADDTLILSRDRFGEKPLYLMRHGGGLYFGSEIKFVVALSGVAPAIDVDHLRRYLINGYKALYAGPHSFFRGVEELQPGTVMLLDADGKEQAQRYWRSPSLTPDEALSYDDAVELVRQELLRAVKIRLRADVPLAFCLSGGVDSNSLIAIAKRLCNFDVHGFTIINTDVRYDEREMVEASVRDLGLRHTAVPISHDGFLDKLRGLIRQHDAPVYTITYYVQWQLMREIAAAGYKVSISGTGADELFSGYYDHHNFYLKEVRHDADRYAAALADWQAHVAPVVRNRYLKDPEVFIRSPQERGHIFLDADEFSRYLTTSWSEPFSERAFADGSMLRNRMLNELFHEIVPPILHEDDLNAMYYSVENRSPFLDRQLFETTLRIPARHLVRRGRAKALLRDAVKDIAPAAVIDNPRKVGFNAPILDLLDTNDSQVRGALLDSSPIFEYVRKDRIEELLKRSEMPNSESKFLFYFVNAKLFLEEFAR